jgi:hypothetical protein
MPPTFERREHHEEIGRAVALVFVIEPRWPPLFHLDRSAHFGSQLLRGLVQANQRNIGIARPRVYGQHVFHGRHERAVGLRRDDPLLFQVRLENVFLSVRPIVLSLARSTMFSSTTLFSNNRNVQRARPLGGFEQAKAISLASRHRKFWEPQAWRAAFGSTQPRSLFHQLLAGYSSDCQNQTYEAISEGIVAGGGRIRTSAWRNQNPLPYRLATM